MSHVACGLNPALAANTVDLLQTVTTRYDPLLQMSHVACGLNPALAADTVSSDTLQSMIIGGVIRCTLVVRRRIIGCLSVAAFLNVL